LNYKLETSGFSNVNPSAKNSTLLDGMPKVKKMTSNPHYSLDLIKSSKMCLVLEVLLEAMQISTKFVQSNIKLNFIVPHYFQASDYFDSIQFNNA
jgi:hypothetical protein